MRSCPLAFLFTLFLCVGSAGGEDQQIIELQSTVGLGNGYGYKLALSPDGHVDYSGSGGRANGGKFLPGRLSYAISQQKARELLDQCSSAWYRSLESHYFPAFSVKVGAAQTIDVGDAPEVRLTCNGAGWSKTVRDVSGSAAPAALRIFEREIVSAAHPASNLTIMSAWISDHPDLKAPGAEMAVNIAAEVNSPQALRLLIEHGAGATSPDAVDAAIAGMCEECIQILRAAGAVVNGVDSAGYTPLSVAAEAGNTRMLVRLLEAGADPNLPLAKLPPLSTAALCPTAAPFVEAGKGFVRHNEISAEWKMSVREQKLNCDEAVQILLDHHANVNAADPDGVTAVMLAVDVDSLETAGLLVQAGADVHARDKQGRSAVDRAEGNPEILKLLEK